MARLKKQVTPEIKDLMDLVEYERARCLCSMRESCVLCAPRSQAVIQMEEDSRNLAIKELESVYDIIAIRTFGLEDYPYYKVFYFDKDDIEGIKSLKHKIRICEKTTRDRLEESGRLLKEKRICDAIELLSQNGYEIKKI